MRFFFVLIFAAALSFGQTRVVPQTFDVVSIKPNLTARGEDQVTILPHPLPGGGFTATNVTVKLFMVRAFGMAATQIEGGPGWIGSDRFDMQARANTSLEMTPEEARPALQATLAARFGLKFHRVTKQGQIFSLTIAKGGPKLKLHSGEGRTGISASTGGGKVEIQGANAPMARLAEYLSGQAGRPVVNHTGLTGGYDFVVAWTADDANAGTSVFTALQEQLGLKAEATKGPIETIVIDSVVKPSGN